MGIPICGACRRPIEERVVTALGKHWHVEHFVCAKCEKPFMGNRHYERKGLAYCETHYHELFGNLCFICNTVIYGDGEYWDFQGCVFRRAQIIIIIIIEAVSVQRSRVLLLFTQGPSVFNVFVH